MMLVRRVAARLNGGGGGGAVWVRRAGSDGRVLSEEEKAAENLYIKKMEQERLEKARSKAASGHSPDVESAGTAAATDVPKADPDVRNKSIAMGAAFVAVLCGVYFLMSSPPAGKKTAESKVEEE